MELYDGASKLEGKTTSHILPETIFKVAIMVEVAEKYWCWSGLDRLVHWEYLEGEKPAQLIQTAYFKGMDGRNAEAAERYDGWIRARGGWDGELTDGSFLSDVYKD